MPQPLINDDIALWLQPKAVYALRAQGIKTLAALTVRIPRRRRWWAVIPELGVAGARRIEAFFAAHPSSQSAPVHWWRWTMFETSCRGSNSPCRVTSTVRGE